MKRTRFTEEQIITGSRTSN